jgi:hypothetical protein
VTVAVGVSVAVAVSVAVEVAVAVTVGVWVSVGVDVAVEVAVLVAVLVRVGVSDAIKLLIVLERAQAEPNPTNATKITTPNNRFISKFMTPKAGYLNTCGLI